MENKKINGAASLTVPVLIIYAVSFILHLILNLIVKRYPTIVIDEGLYTNIARSLAWKGELAFRGQPVNYPYLLYPMLLVPLYWLNRLLGGDIFRWIQVFNTLLICSSVIPAALFALDFTGSRKDSILTVVIVAIMPDMVMGGYTMAESLLWPLSFWMVFSAYRFYTDGKMKYGLLTAFFTGLMFAVKPGAVVAGAVLLGIRFFRTLLSDRKKLSAPLLSLGLLLAIIGMVYGISYILQKTDFSLLGLYEKQTAGWEPKTVPVMAAAFFSEIFLFVFACGGIYGIIPLTHINEYEKSRRTFIISFTAGVLAVLLGTAVFIVPVQWDGVKGKLPLHLRYCAMYIPVMFVFSRTVKVQHKKSFRIALGVFILLSLFPGARVGFEKGISAVIDCMSLAAFNYSWYMNNALTGWILTGITVLFSLMFLCGVWEKIFKEKVLSAAAVYFSVFLLFNSVCAKISSFFYFDPTIADDAREINELAGSADCLGITQRYYDDLYSYFLDSRLNQPMQQVTVDQMFVAMLDSDGVYVPFVPLDQDPNRNNHETPETDKIVLGMTIGEHIELSENVDAVTTGNGHFTFVRFRPGERWADAMMIGLAEYDLEPGTRCSIHIWNENRNIGGMLELTITAAGEGGLMIEDQKIELTEMEKTYHLSLPFKDTIEIRAEGGTAHIVSYTTKAGKTE